MSHLIDGERKIVDDRNKAELLNRAFADKFSDPTVTVLPQAPDYAVDPLCHFSVTEDAVRAILCGIGRHKACGPDNVSARIVSECADELTVPITKLCRLSLAQGVFPSVWKRANIVAIHKKGSKTSPFNYRSVSLLPLFSKVLERIVFNSLYEHVRPVLSERQHGFMPGRSCATNLATMLHTAWSNIAAGSQTDVIYTDYSSAFQSVNHTLLLHKLKHSFHISDKAFDWCESYLSGRRQRVVVKGKCSEWVSVPTGTPEGSILSPILFACFINDLPQNVNTDILMFADDVKMYGRVNSDTDANFLQHQLDILCQWSATWRLTLNAAKCKVLTLTLRRLPVKRAYTIGGIELERVSVMRDLGVLLDEKLTFGDHVDVTVRKANRALGLLIRSFQTGKHGRPFDVNMSKSIMCTFNANVRSVLEFCCIVWGGAAKSHMQRLERVQHKFLIWLCARCRVTNAPAQYKDLLDYFGMFSLAARREQQDILFIRNVHRQRIDSPFLLSKFSLAVPTRLLRNQTQFHVPQARVNTIKNGIFSRIPKLCNTFIDANRDVDIWGDSQHAFRRALFSHTQGRS